MSDINDKFYRGYEGEKEIQFITEKEKIIIWEGFFDDIMEQFRPSSTGWTGLPYYYHLSAGWYDESPWKIPDLKECLHQLEQLDVSNCRFAESPKVLIEICRMLSDAIRENKYVCIAEN